MDQFKDYAAAQATFAQYGCKGNENSYVLAQDNIAITNASNSGAYGGGLVAGMIAGAINDAIRDKKQQQELIPGNMWVMLDVTETGIGALAVRKKGLFKNWSAASVVDGTQLFYMLYSDLASLSLRKVSGAYGLYFQTKSGINFNVRILTSVKGLDYQESGLQAILNRFRANLE